MDDPRMTAEASQIWSMLEDMSENNPAAYRKFIDKQLKEGKEMNGPPKPHMCVQTCISSNWTPVYVNFCAWLRITKPKDDSSPIPVFGSKLIKKTSEKDGEYFTTHVAFHPEVIDQFGKTCKSKDEQDALIQLAFAYIEDQQKLKLSKTYHIVDEEFKGDPKTIREDFGLGKDPMKEEMEKLAKSFAPLADIATKDPELIDRLSSGGDFTASKENLIREEATPDIKIPGMTNKKDSRNKLIEEVKITPNYTITHRTTDHSNRNIVVKIDLDKIESVEQCALDISDLTLKLEATDYHLSFELPEKVNPDCVKAKFSKTRHQLTVTLPTI